MNQEPKKHVEGSAHEPEKAKDKVYDVVFGFDSRAGRLFDLTLIFLILLSVVAVLLDSISDINERYGELLWRLEWGFTLLFTAEYLLRLYSSPHPRGYATSFYGIVDLLSILPTYAAFFIPGAQSLIVIRVLRVLRIFRILKVFRYIDEANVLFRALMGARRKIFIFLFSMVSMIVVFAALMFIIEGPQNGFTSIPRSMYWAIVTITTVGYGDITPLTPLGRAIASMAMITGYAIIAVPTGIVSAELMKEFQVQGRPKVEISTLCPNCNRTGHDEDAHYCKHCGSDLQKDT